MKGQHVLDSTNAAFAKILNLQTHLTVSILISYQHTAESVLPPLF